MRYKSWKRKYDRELQQQSEQAREETLPEQANKKHKTDSSIIPEFIPKSKIPLVSPKKINVKDIPKRKNPVTAKRYM